MLNPHDEGKMKGLEVTYPVTQHSSSNTPSDTGPHSRRTESLASFLTQTTCPFALETSQHIDTLSFQINLFTPLYKTDLERQSVVLSTCTENVKKITHVPHYEDPHTPFQYHHFGLNTYCRATIYPFSPLTHPPFWPKNFCVGRFFNFMKLPGCLIIRKLLQF